MGPYQNPCGGEGHRAYRPAAFRSQELFRHVAARRVSLVGQRAALALNALGLILGMSYLRGRKGV